MSANRKPWRKRLKELIDEWSEVDDLIDTSAYHTYSIGFPDASPEEIEKLYAGVRAISRKYGCSLLVAEIAFEDLRTELGRELPDTDFIFPRRTRNGKSRVVKLIQKIKRSLR